MNQPSTLDLWTTRLGAGLIAAVAVLVLAPGTASPAPYGGETQHRLFNPAARIDCTQVETRGVPIYCPRTASLRESFRKP